MGGLYLLDLKNLKKHEIDQLIDLLREEYAIEPMRAFMARVSPTLPPPGFLNPIIDTWEATRRRRVFATIEMPPRHIKTTTGLHGLAWRTACDPWALNGFATYSKSYAQSRSRIARNLAAAAGVPLSKEMANLAEWRTNEGGGCLFAGFGGAWNGQGIDGVGLVDDPYKSREEADSQAIKDNVWDWFWETFMLRLQGQSSAIVQHTRWIEDDLIGRIKNGEGGGFQWEHIRLPAIAEENDLLERAVGEALWPERVNLATLSALRKGLGEYAFAALFQQRPSPLEGGMFKRHWWRFYKTGASSSTRPHGSTTLDAGNFPERLDQVVLSVDATFKDSKTADNVSILAIGIKRADRYVLNNITRPMGFGATVEEILRAVQLHKPAKILIEDKANGPAIIDTLRSKVPGIIPVTPVGGKASRAAAIEPQVESGNVYLPEGAHWNSAFIEEFAQFPNAKHDDQVDALSQALIYLNKGVAAMRAEMLSKL